MILGKVTGTVVSTSKDENLEGMKLLVVQHLDIGMKDLRAFTVAVDGIGAGIGDYVLVVSGSSARMGTRTKNTSGRMAMLSTV